MANFLTTRQIKILELQMGKELSKKANTLLSRVINAESLKVVKVDILGGGGCLNFIVTLDHNQSIVIKISPYDWIVPLSDYFFNIVKPIKTPVPKIFVKNISKVIIPYEYMIMEYIDHIDFADLSSLEKFNAGEVACKQLTNIHSIKIKNFEGIAPFKKWEFKAWQIRLNYYTKIQQQDLPFSKHEVKYVQSLAQNHELFSKEAHLLHGDFKSENILWTRSNNKVIIKAIIDPNTFFGDPLMDIAITLSHHVDDEFSEGFRNTLEINDVEQEKLNKYILIYLFWLIQNRIVEKQNFEKQLHYFRKVIGNF